MLKSISIHNYHSFVDFHLELPESVVLVGSNGSGKTSLWEVLAGVFDITTRGVEIARVFPTRTLTRWQEGECTQSVSLEIEIDAERYVYSLEINHDLRQKEPEIASERLLWGDAPIYELIDGEVRLYGDEPTSEPRTRFPFNRKRSFLPDIEARHDNQRIIKFRDKMASLWLFAPTPGTLEPTTSEEAAWLDRHGRNFASWFRGVLADDFEVGNLLNEAPATDPPGLQKLAFTKISTKVRELTLSFHSEGADYELAADELSDGQRALVLLYGILVGAIAGGKAHVFFVDEPETNLAPHEMQPWLAQAMNALQERGGQLIVSSHHPAIIDTLAAEQTLCLARPGGGRTEVREITLETTGGARVSDWLARPWAYEDEQEHD